MVQELKVVTSATGGLLQPPAPIHRAPVRGDAIWTIAYIPAILIEPVDMLAHPLAASEIKT
jgi:hypothetical protein